MPNRIQRHFKKNMQEQFLVNNLPSPILPRSPFIISFCSLYSRWLPRLERRYTINFVAYSLAWSKALATASFILLAYSSNTSASALTPSETQHGITSSSANYLTTTEENRDAIAIIKGGASPRDKETKSESHSPDNATEILVSIATSLISSFLFWLALYMRRPRIIISPRVIRHRSAEGIDYYLIKIYNASRSDLVGLKYELHLISPRPNKWITLPDGKQKQVRLLNKTKLKLGIDGARTESMVLKRYLKPSKDVDGDALYAQVFSVRKDKQPRRRTLDSFLSGSVNSYLQFSVYAVHPASGFGKAFTKIYSINDIVDGEEFGWGCSFDVTSTQSTSLSSGAPA